MRNVKFSTGRTYNGPQVLGIAYDEPKDYGIEDTKVLFDDPSRGITGVVTLMEMQCDAGIGRAVLAEYDAGRYELR